MLTVRDTTPNALSYRQSLARNPMATSKTPGKGAARRLQPARSISGRPMSRRPATSRQSGAPPVKRPADAADESAFDRGGRRGVFDVIDADPDEGVR